MVEGEQITLPDFNGDKYGFSTIYRFSGRPTRKGPINPHRTVGSYGVELGTKRKITSKLGFLVEECALQILSGNIKQEFDNKLIKDALKDIRSNLASIGKKTFNTDYEISSVYQQLTKPPRVLFIGDERTTSTNPSLNVLFQEMDRVFNSTFEKDFYGFAIIADEDSGEVIDPNFRYYVEAAETLASLLTEEIVLPQGYIIPNVRINKSGPITQYDGVVVPSVWAKLSKKSWGETLFLPNSNIPWSAIQIKTNHRARYLSGRKLKTPFKAPFERDVNEFQEQLAKCLFSLPNFQFPKSIHFYYLRGTLPGAHHLISLNNVFFKDWCTGVLLKIQNNYFTDEELPLAEVLYKRLVQESTYFNVNKDWTIDPIPDGYIQGGMI